jgi:uracil-DNA glycosylase
MKKINTKVLRLAKSLQNTEVPSDVNNFYAAKRTNKQRHNLQTYLQQMVELQPDTLLVGEAPGYNGCARTGVPFSSEKLIREGVLDGKLFGEENGYYVSHKTVVHEQTAASMWQVLSEVDHLPLLWNAYPFHPHLTGDKNSNRKPKSSELKVGMEILRKIIILFDIKKVVAVGNAAEEVLKKMGLEHEKVRHPSYGGKTAFTNGIKALLKD